MNGGRDKRLGKLELKRRPVARTFYLWRDGAGETLEQVIARSFPDGKPPGAQIRFISWMTADDVKAAEQDRVSLGQADP